MTTDDILRELRVALSAYHAEQAQHPTPMGPADELVLLIEGLDSRLSRGDLLPDAWAKSVGGKWAKSVGSKK